ncbi:hypothetical protein FOL47_003210, partial [Perkinsus chesapeaki]
MLYLANTKYMRAFFYLWFSNLVVLSFTESIKYRNYMDGDEYKGVKLIKCKFKEDKPPITLFRTVVGYIVIYVPFPLATEEEELVRAKLLNPKQEGNFGRIVY